MNASKDKDKPVSIEPPSVIVSGQAQASNTEISNSPSHTRPGIS